MTRRCEEAERMDAPDADPRELAGALAFIRRINRLLGYNAATRRAVGELGGGSVLDVCCGSADFEHEGAYVGLDFHATTLAVARERRPTAALVRGDARALPFGDGSFDVVVCQMALHHFDHGGVRAVCAEMGRVCRVGWVAADLLRRRRAGAWIRLFTLFSPEMVRHDARLSVRQAFSGAEARGLAREVGGVYRGAFGHRFLIVRRKDAEPTDCSPSA